LREAADDGRQFFARAAGVQQHDVDIGVRRHGSAAEAAMRDDRRIGFDIGPLAGREASEGIIEKLQDNHFEQIGEMRAELDAGGAAFVLAAELFAAGGDFLPSGDDGGRQSRRGRSRSCFTRRWDRRRGHAGNERREMSQSVLTANMLLS
jgi:hypothetical protein